MRRQVTRAVQAFTGLMISISLLENAQLSQSSAAEENQALGTARELIANDNSKEALKLLRKSKARINKEEQSEFNFLMARAYQELRDNIQALDYYSRAIQDNPNSAKAFTNRGLVKGALQDMNGALNDLNQSIAIDPKIPETHLNLGVTLAALNKPEKALASFNKALELNENYADAYRNRGIVYNHLKQNKKACADWQKSQQIRPSPDIQKTISTHC